MILLEGKSLQNKTYVFVLSYADNLFGVCQSPRHIDNYQYHLNAAQLSELYHVILSLVADGYTWHHHHTQCVLFEALSRYRLGSVVGDISSICTDSSLNEDRLEAELLNSSQLSLPRMSPNVKTSPSRKYYGAFGEFQNFIQGLEAEDLFALKQFLLKDSSYKRPVSVRTVHGAAKPSVVPHTDGLSGIVTVNPVQLPSSDSHCTVQTMTLSSSYCYQTRA